MTQQASTPELLVVPEPERGLLAVKGPDRASWLNGVVTCDAQGLEPGHATLGLLLGKQGKIQTDFYLIAEQDRLLLALAPDTLAPTHETLERLLVMEDAELEALGAELAVVAVHGSGASPLARNVALSLGGGAAELDLTGLGGAVLTVPRASLDQALAALTEGGATLADADTWLELRVRRAVGTFGVDYGPNDNPHEAGLDRRAISWTKGCYLGQEVVCMLDLRGKLKRRLSLLELEPGETPARGAPVYAADGSEVGEITSARRGAERSFALARLKAPHFDAGSALTVAGRPGRVLPGPA
jgi:folate-binding protein YgfZ